MEAERKALPTLCSISRHLTIFRCDEESAEPNAVIVSLERKNVFCFCESLMGIEPMDIAFTSASVTCTCGNGGEEAGFVTGGVWCA